MADNRESIWWCKFLLLTTFMKTIEVFLTFFCHIVSRIFDKKFAEENMDNFIPSFNILLS